MPFSAACSQSREILPPSNCRQLGSNKLINTPCGSGRFSRPHHRGLSQACGDGPPGSRAGVKGLNAAGTQDRAGALSAGPGGTSAGTGPSLSPTSAPSASVLERPPQLRASAQPRPLPRLGGALPGGGPWGRAQPSSPGRTLEPRPRPAAWEVPGVAPGGGGPSPSCAFSTGGPA